MASGYLAGGRLIDNGDEEPMNEFDEYVGLVRGLVISLSDIRTPKECDEVEHYIDHNENGEALHLLAWIIVESNLRVPTETVRAIRELSDGLVLPEHMPPTLDAHIIETGDG
jgi:hypothetical protein